MECINNDTGFDGLFGSLLSIYNIHEFRLLFHGPDGCRKYFTMITDLSEQNNNAIIKQMIDKDEKLQKMFGTSMSVNDFLSDSSKKIKRSIDEIRKLTKDPIVILPSPGSSLLGIDYDGICKQYDEVLALNGSYASMTFSESFDGTTVELIDWIAPEERQRKKRSINILGLNPMTRCKHYFIKEMTKFLESMDIEIIACFGCDISIEKIKRSTEATINILISREYGIKTAEYYLKKYDVPYVECDNGAPIGFDSLIDLFEQLSNKLGIFCNIPVKEITDVRKQAYCHLLKRNFDNSIGKINYAISGDTSIVLPLVKWLYDSFSLKPCSITINQFDKADCPESIKKVLMESDCFEKLDAPRPNTLDLLFSDRNYDKIIHVTGGCKTFVGLDSFSSNTVDLLDRPLLGLQGSKYILDTVMNINPIKP